MNREAALASLGLQGTEDHATVARVYGQKLSVVQERLVSAQTDADRQTQGARLAELSEAYEVVTGTGRYTNAPADDASQTATRAVSTLPSPPPTRDTFVRMEPGAVIADRLEIGELLGQGGMGNVYAARDRLKEEDVAIKVLRQDLQFSAAAKERFLAEAKFSCSLSHPNIVRVHDVGVSGGLYYISMERLKGQTLRQRMDAYRRDNRAFGIAEVSGIAKQLIDALRYAHRSIVHRDIKPENIWLAEDGTVKLMDFGIARAFSNSQLTQTGIALGTAYYMSPEQRIGSKDVDWRTDQYALGVVLYELFAGTLPTGTVRPVDTLRRDLPKRYASALMRAMSVQPEDRFASLDEMLAEIEAPAPKKFRPAALLLIGGALAAVAAGAFVVLNNQNSAPTPAAATAKFEAPQGKQSSGSSDSNASSASTEATLSTAPTDPPPPEDEVKSASTVVPDENSQATPAESPEPSAADIVSATPLPSPSEQRVAKASTSVSSAVAAASGNDARRKECIAQCERDDGECRSLGRRGKQDCMRAVAFGSNAGRITTTNPAAASCAFYGQSRCEYALNRDACLVRMTSRYKACVDILGGTVTSRRQDCDDHARESDRLCMDELRECRASCE